MLAPLLVLLVSCVLAGAAGWLGLQVTGRDLSADAQSLLSGRMAPLLAPAGRGRPAASAPARVRLARAAVHPLGELRLTRVELAGPALPGPLLLDEVQVYFAAEQAARGRLLVRGAVAQGARLASAGLQATAARLSLRRHEDGWRLTGQGLRVLTPGTAVIEIEAAGAQLRRGELLRAAISGVRVGALGPAQVLLAHGAGGYRFRGELAGAQLRGVVAPEGLEARLDLERFRAPLVRTAELDLRRSQISGGLHVSAWRDGEGPLGWTAVTGEGRVRAAGLTVNHPTLSAAPLAQLDVALEGALALERDARGALRLESSGLTLHLGDLHASLAGAFAPQADGGWRLDLDFTLRPLDCSALLRSLPRALVPKLDGLGVSGRVGGRLALHADSRLLPVLSLENEIDVACRVLRDPPLAAVQDLLNPRLLLERPGPDGALRRLPLGPAAPSGEDGAVFVSLGSVPWPVQRAFLVAEDNLFFVHQGFDGTMIIRALGLDLQDQQAARGASTISQQVAKNLWLGPERSLGRKLEEMVLTWRLEQVVPKARILEVYLNLVELGSGIYGIGAAAQHYFRVPVEELTREQAAQLAALLPAPRRGMDGAWGRRYRELLQRMGRVTIPRAPE